jgi:O-acetyl-ADP-ribose deacetylase (regulator of RNase III)
LLEECRALNGCQTGKAKITKGYKLPAKFVIHTVGPVYEDGKHGEKNLLASCYANSLEIARKNGVTTIAFPCISTGVYGYPFEDACKVALNAIRDFLLHDDSVEKIFLVCFSLADCTRYNRVSELRD